MVDDKGGHFKTMFPDIFADYQNPPLTGKVAMAPPVSASTRVEIVIAGRIDAIVIPCHETGYECAQPVLRLHGVAA